jgi:hypothetical protein
LLREANITIDVIVVARECVVCFGVEILKIRYLFSVLMKFDSREVYLILETMD